MFPWQTKTDVSQKQEELQDAIDVYYKTLEQPQRVTMHRNVLLIGRTRTGKSTLKQMLKDPRVVPGELTLISQTKDTEFETVTIESDMTLTLVDTPGLFDRRSYTNDAQTINREIQEIINMCEHRGIIKFHLVCFCASIESGINDEDLQAIQKFLEYFGPQLAENLCMIITRCESKSDHQRQLLRAEINRDTHFQSITDLLKKGIYFSGALKPDDWNQGNDALLIQFRNICEYRHKLIKLLQHSETTFQMKPMLIRSSPTINETLPLVVPPVQRQTTMQWLGNHIGEHDIFQIVTIKISESIYSSLWCLITYDRKEFTISQWWQIYNKKIP